MAPGSSGKKSDKKRGKKRYTPQEIPNVSEATRIRVAEILEKFKKSNDDVYKFEDNLCNRERATVHVLCRKMGMKSKSSGKGQQRRISVYKTKKEIPVKEKERLVSFTFSEQSKAVLQDLFSRYPPNDVEMTENKIGESSGTTYKVRAHRDDIFCKPAMTRTEIANKVESLASRIEKTPHLRKITEGRSKLPIASFRDIITSTIESHQVAVAERIASERGENVGDSVGFKILMSATIDAERFSKYFGGCPIIRVPGFTHPVKSFYLEDVLSIVKSDNNNRVTCMKSDETMEDASLTDECRVALDEAIDLALSNDEFDPLLELISSEGNAKVFNYQHSKTGVTPLMVFAGKGRVGDICMLLSFGVDCRLQSNAGRTAFDYAEQDNQREAAEIIKKHMDKALAPSPEDQKLLDKYLSNVNPELIDCVLIEQLLRRICNDSKDGAILVFLPGWDDINRTRDKLLASPFFKDPSKFDIISLHSRVPLAEQKKVFKRPPDGCRKIVLSTNIAETSVTIDDVVYVIDSGRMKEKSYDPYNHVSTLQSSWVSKASAKQREGRAGRCQPGICYHLYSKLRAASLPDFQVPEIKRMPIEELCLQVKLIDPSCKTEEFLQKTLDPPVYETIRNAITVLQDIGALTPDEKLTELGEKLGSLPVHPLTSKMLFLAILLNCLDPALTLACASDYRDPFILPMIPNEKKKAQAAKLELASFYGGNGDQLAVIAAFDCWRMAKEKGEETTFCSQYFVSSSTMRMLSRMRKQLQTELHRCGFIPKDASYCSLNARDPGILHAVLVAGLYPMVGRVVPHGRNSLVETVDGNKVRLHPFSTNVKLSFKKFKVPPLIMFDEITRGDGGLSIRDCSVIGSLPLLLLATEIVVAPASENDDEDGESDFEDADDSDEDKTENNDLSNSHGGKKIMSSPNNVVKVVVDRWLPLESTALDVAQIYCLRERLSAAVFFKVKHPQKILPEHLGASLYATACILSYDGMSGISLPNGPVDSLATMVSAADIGPTNNEKKTVPQNYLKSLMNRQNSGHSHSQPSNTTTIGKNQHQKLASESPTVNALETAMYGTAVTTGKISKRQRDLLENCHDLDPWSSRCNAVSNGGFGPPATGLDGVVPSNLTPAWYWTDMYAAEVIYHDRMTNHKCRTLNPAKATAFYIPFYVGLAVGKYLWFNYTSRDRDYHAVAMLNWVKNQPPWIKSNGSDHFIMLGRLTWDFRRLTQNDAEWGTSFIYMPLMKNNESISCRVVDCSVTHCYDGAPAILEAFLDSDFCFQPKGDGFTRRSAFDCMLAGSIPVYFWKGSFEYQYEWHLPKEASSYSVFIDRKVVRNDTSIVKKVLGEYSREEVRRMRDTIIDFLPRLLYSRSNTDLGSVDDAFDVAMEGVLRRFKEQKRLGNY
ncbi:hypothetical protein DH2020_049958 [Rehmannia glutinosa]|uniref:RNA helicase n=1 Tax=Rehmannia glutinosa TaxID=99300 RepID=A0ABR0U1F5_REHGL